MSISSLLIKAATAILALNQARIWCRWHRWREFRPVFKRFAHISTGAHCLSKSTAFRLPCAFLSNNLILAIILFPTVCISTTPNFCRCLFIRWLNLFDTAAFQTFCSHIVHFSRSRVLSAYSLMSLNDGLDEFSLANVALIHCLFDLLLVVFLERLQIRARGRERLSFFLNTRTSQSLRLVILSRCVRTPISIGRLGLFGSYGFAHRSCTMFIDRCGSLSKRVRVIISLLRWCTTSFSTRQFRFQEEKRAL